MPNEQKYMKKMLIWIFTVFYKLITQIVNPLTVTTRLLSTISTQEVIKGVIHNSFKLEMVKSVH